jgi:hypothetical protein
MKEEVLVIIAMNFSSCRFLFRAFLTSAHPTLRAALPLAQTGMRSIDIYQGIYQMLVYT